MPIETCNGYSVNQKFFVLLSDAQTEALTALLMEPTDKDNSLGIGEQTARAVARYLVTKRVRVLEALADKPEPAKKPRKPRRDLGTKRGPRSAKQTPPLLEQEKGA